MQAEAAQVVGHPTDGVMSWVEAQQLSQQGSHLRIGETRVGKLNSTSTLSKACTRAPPKRKAEARCPSTSMGWTT